MVIREARPGDGAAIARVWVEAGEHHVRLDPLHHQHPSHAELDEWCEGAIVGIAARGGVMLVAVDADEVVGFANVALREPVADAAKQIQRDQGERRAYLNAIGVLSPHRRRGAGSALMNAAEKWARDSGAVSMQLDVLPSNAEALALYSRRGFAQTALLLEKRL